MNKNKIKQKGNLPIFLKKVMDGRIASWQWRGWLVGSGPPAVAVRIVDGEGEEKR